MPGHQSGSALAAATTKSSGATGPATGRAIQAPARDLGHQLRVVERTKDGELVLVRRRTMDAAYYELDLRVTGLRKRLSGGRLNPAKRSHPDTKRLTQTQYGQLTTEPREASPSRRRGPARV